MPFISPKGNCYQLPRTQDILALRVGSVWTLGGKGGNPGPSARSSSDGIRESLARVLGGKGGSPGPSARSHSDEVRETPNRILGGKGGSPGPSAKTQAVLVWTDINPWDGLLKAGTTSNNASVNTASVPLLIFIRISFLCGL